MQTKLYDKNGKEIGDITLVGELFDKDVNESLVHRAMMYQLANARVNYAHTRTRGERRGSTRKIYRQKGTGRARMGGNRSPVRKKGGVAFGPRNDRNFTIKMNKKERRAALASALSAKVKSNNLYVVDNFEFDELKTKYMNESLNKFNVEGKILLLHVKDNQDVSRISRNIPTVKPLQVDYVNVVDLLKYENVFFLKEALEEMQSPYQV